jgi:uncharacterized protein
MAENSFGDFFLSDAEDEAPPIGVERPEPPQTAAPEPLAPPAPQSPTPPAPAAPLIAPPQTPAPLAQPAPASQAPGAQADVPPAAPALVAEPAPEVPAAPTPSVPPVASGPTSGETREQRLAEALDQLMEGSPDIQAAALVSLDGFTMASALPEGMQEDRVGAMSAAILGLGERAAIELGRGKLSQVFIQGEGGYVLLIAAGTRSVLTCLADEDAKLGLLLYDMRAAATAVGEILG